MIPLWLVLRVPHRLLPLNSRCAAISARAASLLVYAIAYLLPTEERYIRSL
jgi:hypothetical protein